jgi:hypothetical protein
VVEKANMAPKIFATRQVIQINGLASGSSPITRARGAQTIMPQSFRPINTEEERTLLASVATLALARDQGKGVARLRAYK